MAFPELSTIERRRKTLKITQQQLAKRTGISQSLIAKIENGQVMPGYDIAKRIFTLLDEIEHKEEKTAIQIMNKRVIILKPEDAVRKLVGIAKREGISQFPIIRNNEIIGSITTKDVLGVSEDTKISELYNLPFPMINKTTPISMVKELLKFNQAVLVSDNGKIIGIITPEDLL